jgi:hypothetical protein
MYHPFRTIKRLLNINLPILISVFILTNSCTIPRDSRILKRRTKIWRESKVAFYAYGDTPFSGLFMTLRDNGKFEHTSSGLLAGFWAGEWTHSRDTVRLTYLDSKLKVIRKQNFIIDHQTSTIQFEGDSTPVQLRLRIMTNKIN